MSARPSSLIRVWLYNFFGPLRLRPHCVRTNTQLLVFTGVYVNKDYFTFDLIAPLSLLTMKRRGNNGRHKVTSERGSGRGGPSHSTVQIWLAPSWAELPEILRPVTFQMLWPSATTNCSGWRPQIASLWLQKCCGLRPQLTVGPKLVRGRLQYSCSGSSASCQLITWFKL